MLYWLEASSMFLPYSRSQDYAGHQHGATPGLAYLYHGLHLPWDLVYPLYLRQRVYIDWLSVVTFSSILGEIVTNSNIIMKYPFQIEKSDLRNLKILYKLFSMLIPCSHLWNGRSQPHRESIKWCFLVFLGNIRFHMLLMYFNLVCVTCACAHFWNSSKTTHVQEWHSTKAIVFVKLQWIR